MIPALFAGSSSLSGDSTSIFTNLIANFGTLLSAFSSGSSSAVTGSAA